MKVELPVRWAETVTDPDSLEEIKTRRIISGDDELTAVENQNYTYDLLVCDMKDVDIFHRYDSEHVIIRMSTGDSFCVHIPYETFKELYMQCTGELITHFKLQIELLKEEDI